MCSLGDLVPIGLNPCAGRDNEQLGDTYTEIAAEVPSVPVPTQLPIPTIENYRNADVDPFGAGNGQ